MLIPVAGALRRCVVACFQQGPLPERPPIEEIHATFLSIENSRRFQSDDAAKAGSARISSMLSPKIPISYGFHASPVRNHADELKGATRL